MHDRWKEAERDAGIALDLEPSCVKALFRRATARRELKCYATAKADLEMAVELGGGTEIQAELERVEQELAVRSFSRLAARANAPSLAESTAKRSNFAEGTARRFNSGPDISITVHNTLNL